MTNYIVSPRMRIDEVAAYLNCSRSHLYALNKYEDVAYIAKEAGLLDLI